VTNGNPLSRRSAGMLAIRLLHISDIHFGGENPGALAAFAAFAASGPVDLIVLTGDLTQFGRREEFRRAAAWLRRLPNPKLITPGNHDTPWLGLAERVAAPFARYARWVGQPAESAFQTEVLLAQAINSARGWQIRLNWSKGEVSRRQVANAATRFEAAPTAIHVLACHHPLVEAVGGPMTARVRGGCFAAQRLTAAKVDLVLTGHLHAPFVQALPYGDAMTYAVGAGTLSLRERGTVPGFNVIDIAGGEIVVTAMGWTGANLAVDRTWAVPLRPRS
jgi:3',5'-cyclic AMP phosphodiesterase CpdA